MRLLIIGIIGLSLSVFLGYKLTSGMITSAEAQGAATVHDAGPVAPHDALPTIDENTDPKVVVRTVTEIRDREGLWAAIVSSLFMLLKWLQTVQWAGFSFLRKGRMPAVLSGAVGLAGAMVDHAMGHVTLTAVALALMTMTVAMVPASYTEVDRGARRDP